MQTPRLEHLNVTVSDPDATARMLVDVFGWHVRWSGDSIHEGRTVHVGSEDAYLALYSRGALTPADRDTYRSHLGINHVGIVVDDLDAIEARVKAAGFETYSHQEYEPGRRFYFRNEETLEFEVLSYG